MAVSLRRPVQLNTLTHVTNNKEERL